MSVCHQCLFYEGSPFPHLEAIAARTKIHLRGNYRCLYMNSKTMIAALCSYLSAIGVDVAEECSRSSLVFISEPIHLAPDGTFETERMLRFVEQALEDALRDKFRGLFGAGDMTWEFGPKRDFSRLLEYEWRLELFLREHPQLEAICQYGVDALPREALNVGVIIHESIFVNEALSLTNPNYIGAT